MASLNWRVVVHVMCSLSTHAPFSREKIQDKLVQYRQDGAELRFSESAQVHNTTQSQIFSEVANASRRASTAATAVGSDPANHYRRPSILSFVKEVM